MSGWVQLVGPVDLDAPQARMATLLAALHTRLSARARLQLLVLGTHRSVGLWLRLVGIPAVAAPDLFALLAGTHPDLQAVGGPPQLPSLDAGPGGDGRVAGAAWTLARPLLPLAPGAPAPAASGAGGALALLLGALSGLDDGAAAAVSLVGVRTGAARVAADRGRAGAWAGGRAPRALVDRVLDVPGALVELLASPGVVRSAPAAATPDVTAAGRAALAKTAHPSLRVTLRTAAWLPTGGAGARHAALAAALGSAAAADGATLLARTRPGRTCWTQIADAHADRRAATWSTADIATVVHLPPAGVEVAGLARVAARHRAARRDGDPDQVALGTATRGGELVGVAPGALARHAYVVGPSGTGKTTLLARLVLGLVDAGVATVVLDPHGDLARQVLAGLDDEAATRTDVLDLDDPARLPSLNPLWVAPDGDPARRAVARATRSAAVTALFADLWGLTPATAPNLLHFLEAALAALVASGDGCLAQLPVFLTDASFRREVVARADDARVAARWAEFAALGREDRSRTVRAIVNKAAAFDRNPVVATVFGDPGPGLDLGAGWDAGRCLVARLPRGLLPEGTVELLGSLLVTLLHQEALSRERRPLAARPLCVAVIDEFQEFALSAFAQVVTATRKYGLGLVVANQNLSRVASVSPDVLATLLANVATVVSFRTAPGDAGVLAPLLPPFTPVDLAALPARHAYLRTLGPDAPWAVSMATLPPVPARRDDDALEALAARRRLPGRPMVLPAAARQDRSRAAQLPDGPGW